MFRITGLVILLFIQLVFARVPLIHPRFFGESRIVGGNNARAGQFPYQVSLRNVNMGHYCGASVVSTHWVLSAAHCTIHGVPSGYIIYVGSHLLSSGGTSYRCVEIRNHPKYNANGDDPVDNDVSLLRTNLPLTSNGAVQAIPLINREVLQGTLTVSGWGQVETGKIPDNLQYLETKVVSRAECGKIYKLNPDTFCTLASKGKGNCFGDSGGPLVVPGEGQVGINSFIGGGCGHGYPDGFASVFYHRAWIINNTT